MLKVNEYFEGRVKSIGFDDSDGHATMGVMDVGHYQFSTSTVEIMSVITGELSVKLPGGAEWEMYPAGTAFTVGKGESFDVRVEQPSTYVCRYR